MAIPTPSTGHVQIPLPTVNFLMSTMGECYRDDKTLNVMKAFAGTEDMFPAIQGMIKAVFAARGIDPRIREVIALRVAKHYNVLYEWQAQAALARNVGLSDDEIEAVASDTAVSGINRGFMLVCAAADELCVDGTLSDATLSELLVRHGSAVTSKAILIASWFILLSCFINGSRVPLETTDKIGKNASPIG
jgi:alkylhydroperoxidase family enzyme